MKPIRLCVFFLLLQAFHASVGTTQEMRVMDINKKLWSEDGTERDAAVTAILAGRREALFQCYQIVLSFAPHGERRDAVRTASVVLGRFRAVEAVPLLVDNLSFHIPPCENGVKRIPSLGDVYPCAEALVEIGLPALDRVLDRVEMSEDKNVLELGGVVIRKVLGADLAVVYVERRMTQSSDAKIRQRLLQLKEWIGSAGAEDMIP